MSIIRSYQHGWHLLRVIVLTGFVAGCSSIPKEAYQLPQSSLSEREAQTRTFDVSDDSEILQASVALLQDMEYNVDAIAHPLGVLSASKVVDADSAQQKAALAAADVAYSRRSYVMSRCVRWGAMLLCVIFAGCASTPPNVTGSKSQLEARQIQSRDYDTLDKRMTLRSAVATLQDLGFTIDYADLTLGTITATRLYHHDKYVNYTMRMTVSVQKKDGKRVSVRANAPLDEQAIADPKTYQDFFVALDKAMFLTMHKVD